MDFLKRRYDWIAAGTLGSDALPKTPKYRRLVLVACALAVSLLCTMLGTVAQAQCATGNLAVIVNKSSKVDSLSVAQLRRLILGDVRTWPDQKPVNIVSREAASSVAQCVLSKVVRLSESEYRRYLMNAEFRGEEAVTTQTVNSDANAARIVAGAGSAFAVVDAASVAGLGGAVKVVRIGGKLPGEAGYPL